MRKLAAESEAMEREEVPDIEWDEFVLAVSEAQISGQDGRAVVGYHRLHNGLQRAQSLEWSWAGDLMRAWAALGQFKREHPTPWYPPDPDVPT